MVATLALFIALGGGAYAATQVKKNSVGTKQLKRNAVRTGKVMNGSLLAADFRAGQLPSGPQGPNGAPGPRGEAGATDVVTRYGNLLDLEPSSSYISYAQCQPGEPVTGGGYDFPSGRPSGTDCYISADRPSIVVKGPNPIEDFYAPRQTARQRAAGSSPPKTTPASTSKFAPTSSALRRRARIF